MRVTGKEIRFARRIKFAKEDNFDGYINIDYFDETGDEKRKRLIEDLIDRMLDEAKEIIESE